MKGIEKFGWFILAIVIIYIAVTVLVYLGNEPGHAYGTVLTVFIGVMFAELMDMRGK